MKKLNTLVNSIMGSGSPGNCLPGPYLPFGMAKPGPDMLHSNANNGYRPDLPIEHFSQNHVSGTGGGGRYGNVGILPLNGRFSLFPGGFDFDNEIGTAGYYQCRLLPSMIQTKITATNHVGVYNFSFPSDFDSHCLLNPGSAVCGDGASPGEEGGICIGGFSSIQSEFEIIGRADFKGGWGHRFPYSVYFVVSFDKPMISHTVGTHEGIFHDQKQIEKPGHRVVAHFGKIKNLTAKVSISYVSIAKARKYLVSEASGSFDEILTSAQQVWESWLKKIIVTGGIESDQIMFYTLMTKLLCQPTDLGTDDEFHLWHSGFRQFTDFYCFWDSARNANALLTLLDPDLTKDFLNACLDIAEHTGWIPDSWIAGSNGYTMGGCTTDVLFTESALKGIEGIDYHKALFYMQKNSDTPSPDPFHKGRFTEEYNTIGYIPFGVSLNCVSRTLEYAYQDWCIGSLAEKLGNHDTANTYYKKSQGIWKLWNDELKLFAPKDRKGDWQDFSPDEIRWDSWNDPNFFEATARQWVYNVQHDMDTLITKCGGSDAFYQKLEGFFESEQFYPKETMMHIPYLYHYTNNPGRGSFHLLNALRKFYHPTHKGLPDNEDMGCQSAFFICSAIGLYPMMGQDWYFLSSPIFDKVELHLGNGEILSIIAKRDSKNQQFIKSIKLNGEEYLYSWINHQKIWKGGVLEFEMTSDQRAWKPEGSPPSPFNRQK